MFWKHKKQEPRRSVDALAQEAPQVGGSTPLDMHRFRAAVRLGLLLDCAQERATESALFAVQAAAMQADVHPDAYALRLAWQRGTAGLGADRPVRPEGSGLHLHLITDPLTRVAIGARLADHMPYEVLAQAWPHRSAQRFAADLAEQAQYVYRQHTMNPTVPHSVFTAVARLIDAGASVAQIVAMERFSHDDVDAVAAFFDDFRAAARRLTDGGPADRWCPLFAQEPQTAPAQIATVRRQDAAAGSTTETLPRPSREERRAAAGMHTLRHVTVFRSVMTFATVAGITAMVVVGGLVGLSRIERAPTVLGAETTTDAALAGAQDVASPAKALDALERQAAASGADADAAALLHPTPDHATLRGDAASL